MAEQTPSMQTYAALLASIKQRIQTAQVRAALAVSRELVLLYWGIGSEITRRQKSEGWGTKLIDNPGRDLKSSFPEMRGLSPRNLKYLKTFAEAWPEESIVQQLAAQLPWFDNCVLLDTVKPPTNESGTFEPPSKTAGVATSWSSTSKPDFIAVKGRR